jgi:hypothetical protein
VPVCLNKPVARRSRTRTAKRRTRYWCVRAVKRSFPQCSSILLLRVRARPGKVWKGMENEKKIPYVLNYVWKKLNFLTVWKSMENVSDRPGKMVWNFHSKFRNIALRNFRSCGHGCSLLCFGASGSAACHPVAMHHHHHRFPAYFYLSFFLLLAFSGVYRPCERFNGALHLSRRVADPP